MRLAFHGRRALRQRSLSENRSRRFFVEPVLIPAQAINKNAPTSGASLFMAERQGFEPWNTREDVTGIPVQRLRPLGHLSINLTRASRFGRFDHASATRDILSGKLNSGRLDCFEHLDVEGGGERGKG